MTYKQFVMVMKIEPIDLCIMQLKKERTYDEVIYLTPDGEQLNQTSQHGHQGPKHVR